jgi:archaellum component FlaC
MEDIKKDIKEINEKLDKLTKHIDFIETTYTMVRNPLSYVCSKLSMGQTAPALPEINVPKSSK